MAYYRGAQLPRDEPYMSPPSQRNPNRWSANMATTNDSRGILHRRFTTNTVPTLSPIGQQRRQAAGDMQANATQSRMTPSERAARHYETLLQAQRRIQEELEKVDAETRREVDENIRHEQSVTQLFAQSEPTTPPEYQNAFPNDFSRPNRYSTASLMSPPGIGSRSNRASAQFTSPSSGYVRPYTANNGTTSSNLPSHSVPGSRRESDDEQEEDTFIYSFENTLRRAGANPNRNSMPITSYDRKRNTTDLVFGPLSTAGFLFNDEIKLSSLAKSNNQTSPPDSKTYLQVQHTADGFPKLIRREDNSELSMSTASAALDLASELEPEPTHVAERASANRHRISLPPSALSGSTTIAPLNSILANANDSRPSNNRRSMEVKFSAETKRPALLASPPHGLTNGSHIPLSSYSTNDIPTLKSINGDKSQDGGVPLSSPPSQQANLSNATSPEQNRHATLHSLLSSPQRQSRDFSLKQEDQDIFHHSQSALHASAAPFAIPQENEHFNSPNMPPFTAQPTAYYGGYGMQMLNNSFNNMSMGANGFQPPPSQGPWPNQFAAGPYGQAPSNFGGFQQQQQQYVPNTQAGPGAGRFDNANSGSRANAQQRRQAAEDAQAKYQSVKVEQLTGEIYSLCKDQHGCRFLQRKLEERNEQTVEMIFNEVKEHMIELMVDPFGNYLCQKLLESANDDQRTILIEKASPAMTKIALNQHGTRALQKMIEFITTPEQTKLIIKALGNDVVLLIQDLNGNHVIQKCLNHLSSTDATFIFEAVGANCITVGTHRHGCCVLQRCIDHADGLQKGEMVNHVIRNAYALVQDPFGNYVVQYILDLSEPCFTEPLCRAFYGEIPALSKQKFSSNVIEKCIRCSSVETRREFVRELAVPQVLEKLLRDGFANYVIQTAMDFADDELKPVLYENVRMILPSIRNTPHGRRIQSKLTEWDNRSSNTNNSILSPLESAELPADGQFAPAQHTPSRANRHGMIGAPAQWGSNGNAFRAGGFDFGTNGFAGDSIASPAHQRGNQNSFMFNAGQAFHNGYGSQPFATPGAQPYGHF